MALLSHRKVPAKHPAYLSPCLCWQAGKKLKCFILSSTRGSPDGYRDNLHGAVLF